MALVVENATNSCLLGLAEKCDVSRQAVAKWESGDWDIIVTSLRKPYK